MKRFRPGVLPTVVVALLLPLLVSLGFWQLGRGAEKTALLGLYLYLGLHNAKENHHGNGHESTQHV